MPQYSRKVEGYLNCHLRKKKQDKEVEVVLASTDKLVH